jgi:branched-chain amino acid transport system ATP-binding protein
MCLIPEGRGIFRSLTVRENLELLVPPWQKAVGVEPAVLIFPVLGERMNQLAGSLSGGEQQMLAFSRAHLVQPKLVLLDEVSLGLAPIIVDEIFVSLSSLVEAGSAVLLVEQYVHRAIEMADYVYVLSRGQVAWEGPASELDQEALSNSYLGADL